MIARRLLIAALFAALLLMLPMLCRASATPPQPAGADTVAMPAATALSYYYDAFDQSAARPLTRAFDASLLVRKLGVGRREAANLDGHDDVRLPSTWWQPRVGFRPVSVEDMRTGPGPGTGPGAGKWTIVAGKGSGASKGFTAEDSAGVRFAIKFDVPAWPELGTGADAVVCRLYWAAGYNVPDNTVAFVRREDLVISPKATYKLAGKKRAMTAAYLDALLAGVPREPDGTMRVVASRYLKGKPLGEWRYDGRRKDDAEDLVPHELRREIRGLWAINAWLNHTDCSARNTLDMYVHDGGRSFVRHYLMDFSGCLGSASIAAQPLRSGHEYWADYQTITRSVATLSLPAWPWEASVDPQLEGAGFIDAATFDPQRWRPYLPNPAFDVRTRRDVEWGARIVAGFTDAQIRAAVEQGRYSDPRVTEYLVRVLEERRDKIARHWLTPAAAGVTVAAEAPSPTASRQRSPGLPARAGRAATNFLSDGWTIASSPVRARGMTLVYAGVFLGAEGVLFANDEEVRRAITRNRRAPGEGALLDVGTSIAPVGFMGRTVPYYAGALVLGYALDIRVVRTLSTEILESHFLAGGLRNVGKTLIGREHPYQNNGPYQFGFNQGTSFPSGHTSIAFELATIASMNAKSLPVTLAAYVAATSIAAQRIDSGNHWPSDVLFAAMYGTLISRTVVRLHEARERGDACGLTLVPHVSADGQSAGVGVLRRF